MIETNPQHLTITSIVYADFGDLLEKLCPLCTSAYQPGCSTVAVNFRAQKACTGDSRLHGFSGFSSLTGASGILVLHQGISCPH